MDASVHFRVWKSQFFLNETFPKKKKSVSLQDHETLSSVKKFCYFDSSPCRAKEFISKQCSDIWVAASSAPPAGVLKYCWKT